MSYYCNHAKLHPADVCWLDDECTNSSGPWGAWRSVVASVEDDDFDPARVVCMNAFDVCRGEECRDCHANPAATSPDFRILHLLAAVGWSP